MREELEKYKVHPANFALFSKKYVLLQRLFSIADFNEIKAICWHFFVLSNWAELHNTQKIRQ